MLRKLKDLLFVQLFPRASKKYLGKRGEDYAVQFLGNQDHKIIARNFKTKLGEIDIISLKDSCIHFYEVKVRTSDAPDPFRSQQYHRLTKAIDLFWESATFSKMKKVYSLENDEYLICGLLVIHENGNFVAIEEYPNLRF